MKSTDEGINVVKAKEAITEMQTPEEIIAYTDGEERSTIMDFAESRIKSIEKAKAEENARISPPPAVETVAVQDCWRYHPVQEPRIFRKGETIPDGWTNDAAVRKLWRCDPFGHWSRE